VIRLKEPESRDEAVANVIGDLDLQDVTDGDIQTSMSNTAQSPDIISPLAE
jgi:hypothetical protein